MPDSRTNPTSSVRRLAVAALAALATLAILAPASAHAWAWGDTLTTIWRPLPNLPALARPGDAITVWANAPSTATGWSASLKYGSYTAALSPAGGGYVPATGRWELAFTVPPGTPEDVFDLQLTSSATVPDVSKHSVKVLPAYRTSYYFAQISDTHLPEHTFSVNNTINTADTSGFPDFEAVAEDLNLIHPEFIIHTGDLVNEGELEDFLGMFEMSRAKEALSRLRDPVFVVTGNHDIGGWQATAPPDGTSRFNWWKLLGWPFLNNPPSGDPGHSQDYSFDYGALHCIGLEAYINNGSYDHYLTSLYGAQSFSPEQMSWLTSNIAAVPPGHTKLLFYHYDFGGTLANGLPGTQYTQINPTALGIDGAIWGHFHTVAEDQLTARSAKPFNLGLQSVIDHRAFRIFRVTNGVMTPGPMHHSGGIASAPTDSLQVSWNGPNDGTALNLTATVVNRFGEAWDHARLLFHMAPAVGYTVTGGTSGQVFMHDGQADVDVDCVVPASGTIQVNVVAGTAAVDPPAGATSVLLANPAPNPFIPGAGTLTVEFTLTVAAPAELAVFDLFGRRVATLEQGLVPAGVHTARWDGRDAAGRLAPVGAYVLQLDAGGVRRALRFVIAR